MPDKKLTSKQQAIQKFLKTRPEASVKEIGVALGASPGSIYQQLSRMRAAGHLLPKKAGKRSRPRGRPKKQTGQEAESMVTGPSIAMEIAKNPQSLEEHLEQELRQTGTRIEEILEAFTDLENEKMGLTDRLIALENAQKVLTTK